MPTVLITGGSGHVGLITIVEFLKQNYKVHTTVRDTTKTNPTLSAIQNYGQFSNQTMENLRFFNADLESEDGWAEAMESCDYVIHIAFPIIFGEETLADLMDGGFKGTLRILELATKSPTVKQVIYTGTFATVSHEGIPIGSEVDETVFAPFKRGITSYAKCKIILGHEIWDYVNGKANKNSQNPISLTVLEPAGILGPVPNNNHYSVSTQILKSILDGSAKTLYNYDFSLTDVRDLAKAFVSATGNSKAYNERFLIAGKHLTSFPKIVDIIKAKYPSNLTAKFPTQLTPKVRDLDYTVNSEKAHCILGYDPISVEKTVVDTVESILHNIRP